MLPCKDAIPSEVVINVDNPDEAAEWASYVYPTEGFVVPVFSFNLHEGRGFNRAVQIARGDIVVLMQVWSSVQVGMSPCAHLFRCLITSHGPNRMMTS